MPDEQTYLDITSLPSIPTDEDRVEVDPSVDTFALPPPANDGNHLAKLMYGGDDPQKRWQERNKNGVVYYATSITGKIISPGNEDDGKVFFDNFVSTMMFRGTSRVIGVLKALGHDVSTIGSHIEQVRALDDYLRGEPTCIVRTQWESQYNTGQKDDRGKDVWKTIKKGQTNFPFKNGRYNHILESPLDGSDCPAQARPLAYLNPDEER